MPELPEVETIRRDLEKVLIGKKIVDCFFAKTKVVRGNPRVFRKTIIGNQVTRIERIGKLLMFALASGEYLLVHLKMTGQLFYARGARVMARGGHSLSKGVDGILPNKHTRAVIMFANRSRLFFNDMRLFGYLTLVDERQKQAVVKTYGIEPLTRNFTLERFNKIFTERKTSVKAVLLNQKLIAGIGNIYADEICFAAGVKPTRAAVRLTNVERSRLWRAVEDVLTRAIAARGTTFNSYVDGEGRQGSFLQQLAVYGRGEEPCRRCGAALKKIRVAGRGTVYCPYCQH